MRRRETPPLPPVHLALLVSAFERQPGVAALAFGPADVGCRRGVHATAAVGEGDFPAVDWACHLLSSFSLIIFLIIISLFPCVWVIMLVGLGVRCGNGGGGDGCGWVVVIEMLRGVEEGEEVVVVVMWRW